MGKRVAGALNALAILSAIAVTGLTFFLVMARGLNISVVGLHEIILLCALLMYMAGAVIASRRRQHLVIDWIETGLHSRRRQAAHRLVVALISGGITVFFIYWTYRMFAWGLKRPQVTPAYGIPLWFPQLSLLIGSIGCFLYCLRDGIRALTELLSRQGSAR